MNPSWISDLEADDEAGVARRLLQRRLHEPPNPPPVPIPDQRQRIQENKVAAIMEMGFSREEATMALNWENGNLQAALNHLVGE
jgi:hypothetical protein